MKWLDGLTRAVRKHRAVVTAAAVALADVAAGVPLLGALGRLLVEVWPVQL